MNGISRFCLTGMIFCAAYLGHPDMAVDLVLQLLFCVFAFGFIGGAKKSD